MERILYIDRNWESPYAMSAFVALVEKQLPFETRELALEHKEHTAPAYRALTHRVPALVEDDFWLAESSALAEYLEDVYPAPQYARLLPADPRKRAVCRQVQAWLRSDFLPIREERPTTSVFFAGHRATAPLSASARRSAEQLVHAAEQLLPGGRDSLFDAYSIADTDLAMMLMRLHANGDPLPAALARYAETQWQRPSVQRWVGHPRPAVYVPH